MHVCCGVCATYPLVFLAKYFSHITILFSNSNIYPNEEYVRRLNELKRFITIFNEKNDNKVSLIEFPYDNEEYNNFLKEYGDVKEGGARCFACYKKRMEQTYAYADEHHFDYFTTVMTISRQKNSQVLNQIGIELAKKFHTKYFLSDFKKNKGSDYSAQLRKEYNLYSQQYCGCVYSYNDYLKRKKNDQD
jgi:hypothetical protein